jgi:hypothetical protein
MMNALTIARSRSVGDVKEANCIKVHSSATLTPLNPSARHPVWNVRREPITIRELAVTKKFTR